MEKATETRVEISYGLQYMEKVFGTDISDELLNAVKYIRESRMAMGRLAYYAGSPDPYVHASNIETDVIEMDVDVADFDDEGIQIHPADGYVKQLKYCIKAFRLGLSKMVEIRMKRLPITDPQRMYLATRSLERAIDLMETGICYLGADLRRYSMSNPGKYPTEFIPSEGRSEHREVPEENKTTDELMENRATETSKDENNG